MEGYYYNFLCEGEMDGRVIHITKSQDGENTFGCCACGCGFRSFLFSIQIDTEGVDPEESEIFTLLPEVRESKYTNILLTEDYIR
jgi:hypothetical protein